MRKFLAGAAIVGFFAVAAYAAEVEGTVEGVDKASRTILLEDGTAFVVAESIDLKHLDTGARVKIVFDETTMQATMIETEM